MSRPAKIALGYLLVLAGVLTVLVMSNGNLAILDPKGLVALKERNLIVIATLLSLIVVLPVFILTFAIAWKYRAGNTKAVYAPNWDHNRTIEAIWWAIPCIIILVLSVITWQSSHELDPYKPLTSDKKPLTVQVVALPWKWLFIYPEQRIATVNYLQIPEDRPVNFQLTADAPMNSFWIPQLGGQIYAMPGMSTKLHLMATEQGTYAGSSANLSGEGFAGMKFKAQATSPADFERWVAGAQKSAQPLNWEAYSQLAQPSKNNAPAMYTVADGDLYNKVVMKYMMPPSHQMSDTEHH